MPSESQYYALESDVRRLEQQVQVLEGRMQTMERAATILAQHTSLAPRATGDLVGLGVLQIKVG